MLKRYKFSLLILLTLIYSSVVTPLNAAKSPTNQTQERQIKSKYLALSWSSFANIFRRKKPPKGGRGSICLIAPQRLDDPVSKVQGTEEVWSLNPLFLWNLKSGEAKKIELFEKGSNEVFWSKEIPEEETSFMYDGQPLKPGKSYEWRIIANAPFPMKSISAEFKVMESQKRLPITIRLALLENNLNKQGASAEKIALEKASYFVQKELWSDFVGEIYKVKNPSTELHRQKQQIESSDYCN
jgi:hypothetical protein